MRVTGVILVAMLLLSADLGRASTVDWDAWYNGDVEVQLRVRGGEGAVFDVGADVSFEFEANESAYHMVVGIDPLGEVQLLFPRYWEDDGWLRRGSIQQLQPRNFASGPHPWRGRGIVHVEVIASPTPFDWHRVGLSRSGEVCRWSRAGRPWTVVGDPYEALNDLHRRLFPRWDHALFTVDSTWFSMGGSCHVPVYLGYEAQPIPAGRRHPVHPSRLRIRWDWQFGVRCARPVYRSVYRPVRPRRVVVDVRSSRRSPQVRQEARVDSDPRVRRKWVTTERRRSTSRHADAPADVRRRTQEKSPVVVRERIERRVKNRSSRK